MNTIEKLQEQINQIAGAIMDKENKKKLIDSEISLLEQQANFYKCLIDMVKAYDHLLNK